MNRFCLGLIACLAFYSSTALSETGASNMGTNKLDAMFAKIDPVEKFKQRIQFDQLVSREDSLTRICAKWEQLPIADAAQGLTVSGPAVSVSQLAFDKGQTRYKWELSGAGKIVTVHVVDALTAPGARKVFMANAEGDSMMEIPYVKAADNLGTVSAISNNAAAGYTRLFWIYRNMYFEVNARGAFDQLALARFVQQHAEKNVQAITR
jgi:hypothetical protein